MIFQVCFSNKMGFKIFLTFHLCLHAHVYAFFFLSLVCVYVFVCACVYIHMGAHTNVFSNQSPPLFLKKGFSLDLEFTDLARIVNQEAPGTSMCALPQYWDTGSQCLCGFLGLNSGPSAS